MATLSNSVETYFASGTRIKYVDQAGLSVIGIVNGTFKDGSDYISVLIENKAQSTAPNTAYILLVNAGSITLE